MSDDIVGVPGSGAGDAPRQPAAEAFCAELAARVLVGRAELVAAMLRAVRASVPAYADLSAGEVHDVQRSAVAAAGLFLRTLGEGRPLSAEERASIEAIGEQRATQGVPLEAIDAAVGAGIAAGHRHLRSMAGAMATEVGSKADRDRIWVHLATHVQLFHAGLWAAFRVGYDRIGRPAVPDNDRLVERALHGDPVASAESLTGPLAILAVAGESEERRLVHAGAHGIRSALTGSRAGAVQAEPWPHAVVLAPYRTSDLASILMVAHSAARAAGVIVVAEPSPALAQVASRYAVIRRRLPAIPTSGLPPGVTRAVDLALAAAAVRVGPEERFVDVKGALGEVLKRRRDYATKTIDALAAFWDAGGEVKQAARRLAITERQLRERLHTVEAYSRRRLADPRQLAHLGWALHLYRTGRAELPPAGSPAWGCRTAITPAASSAESEDLRAPDPPD